MSPEQRAWLRAEIDRRRRERAPGDAKLDRAIERHADWFERERQRRAAGRRG